MDLNPLSASVEMYCRPERLTRLSEQLEMADAMQMRRSCRSLRCVSAYIVMIDNAGSKKLRETLLRVARYSGNDSTSNKGPSRGGRSKH
jgi:hypothetical protein